MLFSPLGTGLDDLGALISNISPVLGPIGTIFDDLGNLSTVIGNTIQEFGVNLVPAIDTPLFDIPVQQVNFGSALFDLLTGQPVAADAVRAAGPGHTAEPERTVGRGHTAGPERTIRHRPQFIVRRGHGPGLNSAYSLPLSGSQSAAKRPLQCRRGRLHYANERRSHDAELILDAAWHHTAPSAGRPSVGRGRTEPRPLQIKQRGLR